MGHRRIVRGWTTGLLSLLVILMGFTGLSAAAAKSGETSSTITLRVSACPTSYATPPEEDGDVPFSESVRLPEKIRHDFALFTDSKREMAPLLAPRGWHCSVDVGEDGSAGIFF